MTPSRAALITGCGKPDGMGRAIARTMAAAGTAVVVTDAEPAGVLGQPADIAAAVAYLASEGSGYMTGQLLVLDGGGLSAFPIARPAGVL